VTLFFFWLLNILGFLNNTGDEQFQRLTVEMKNWAVRGASERNSKTLVFVASVPWYSSIIAMSGIFRTN
jgi:hypothetical protein